MLLNKQQIKYFTCLMAAWLFTATAHMSFAREPEPATAASHKKRIKTSEYMVVTAHPLATKAAADIIEAGGSAMDATIAAQMTLNVVEPQSSGIGGGGFMLYWDAKKEQLVTIDGRETAPALSHENQFLDHEKLPMPFYDAAKTGLSVGTPGLVHMLSYAHNEYGTLEWKGLFNNAIRLSYQGFKVTPRLHTLIQKAKDYNHNPKFKTLFLDESGNAPAIGSIQKNPALGQTMENLAKGGNDYFYSPELAKKIEKTVQSTSPAGFLRTHDLQHYRAVKRDPLCGSYHDYIICGMGPPSSGTLTILQTLGILEHFDLDEMTPYEPRALHLILEAQKLAFADRNYFVADSDFIPVPIEELLDDDYLLSRSLMINPDEAMLHPVHGDVRGHVYGDDNSIEHSSTTHISIRDKQGNIVSLTSSIEHAFGSGLIVDGFLLNNQLTDFAFVPKKDGKRVANRVQPNKRARSSMSPTIVFTSDWEPIMVIGSPGGSSIIPYVTKTLINVLDWDMDLQTAINAPHYMNKNGQTIIEAGGGADNLSTALIILGHNTSTKELSSGLHGFTLDINGKISSGVDPRREGMATGK